MAAFTLFILSLFLGFVVSFGASFILAEVQSTGADETGEPEPHWRLLAIGVLMISGPYVLARETISAQTQGEWPDVYLAGGYLLSGLWGAALGFAILQAV